MALVVSVFGWSAGIVGVANKLVVELDDDIVDVDELELVLVLDELVEVLELVLVLDELVEVDDELLEDVVVVVTMAYAVHC